MAYPKLKAEFFANAIGLVICKAPPLSRRLCLQIYDRDGGVCKACNLQVRFGGQHVSPFQRIKSGAIDHIFPRSRGGQNTTDNLRLLCKSCNSQKVAS